MIQKLSFLLLGLAACEIQAIPIDTDPGEGSSAQPATLGSNSKAKLVKAYDVDFTTDDNGGCKSWETQVVAAWSDATAMLGAGRSSVLEIRFDRTNNRKDRLDETQPFNALFQNKKHVETLAAVAAFDVFEDVRRNHWNAAAKGSSEGKDDISLHLRCGDSFLQYQDAAKAFVGTNLGDSAKFWWPGANKDANNPICDGKRSFASASWFEDDERHAVVVICPKEAFVGRWQAPKVKMEMVEEDSIEEFETTAAFRWGYEMVRYTVDPDEVSFDPAEDQPQSVTWANAAALAKADPNKALKSPGNYILYAATQYEDEWCYPQGIADMLNDDDNNAASGPSSDTSSDDEALNPESPGSQPPGKGKSKGGASPGTKKGGKKNWRQRLGMKNKSGNKDEKDNQGKGSKKAAGRSGSKKNRRSAFVVPNILGSHKPKPSQTQTAGPTATLSTPRWKSILDEVSGNNNGTSDDQPSGSRGSRFRNVLNKLRGNNGKSGIQPGANDNITHDQNSDSRDGHGSSSHSNDHGSGPSHHNKGHEQHGSSSHSDHHGSEGNGGSGSQHNNKGGAKMEKIPGKAGNNSTAPIHGPGGSSDESYNDRRLVRGVFG